MRNSSVSRTEFDLIAQTINELQRRVKVLENQHTPTVPVYLSGFPDDSIPAQLALAPFTSCTWAQEDPATVPDARGYNRMAYDPVRDEVVMFGGNDGVTDLSDTWVYSVTADQWTLKAPAHAPSARSLHGMAWDAVGGGVLLFGGFTGLTNVGDTWRWDGTDWTNLAPTHAPSTRYVHAMSAAPGIGNVVLFGGVHLASVDENAQTWTWDGTDWTQQSPATSPPKRQGMQCVYDQSSGNVVLFGGIAVLGSTASYSDTWVWDGSTWTDVTPADPADSPTVTHNYALAYSANCGHVVLFGGLPSPDGTWMWVGGRWLPRTSTSEPTGTDSPGFSDSGGPAILFGGFPGPSPSDDTWSFGA